MDRIYYNGKIITMEGLADVFEPEAVLVSEGKIAAVGSLEVVKRAAMEDAEQIDLQGRCLMPSFIDPHGHITLNGQMSLCADLSECDSFDDIVRELESYMEAHPVAEGGILMGFGYDHNFLKEQAQPDKRVLDRVSEEIPIMILHTSAHLACVNSAMLELSKLTADTPDPEGGVYGRTEDGRELSGYVEEAGMVPFHKILAERMKMDVAAMMANMQTAYIENGVTTAQDGASSKADIQLLQAMAQQGFLKIDVVAYPVMGPEGDEIMHTLGEAYREYHNHLKIGGYKLVLDGSPQGRTAWMSKPYLGGEEGYCGYPWMKDEDVEKYALQAVREGKQLLAHCNGDAASEQFLNAYEKAVETMAGQAPEACHSGSDDRDPSNLRPVMIHCQTVRNDQLERMAAFKMIASIFIGHVYYWGDVHRKNFGMERGNHISPARDALDRGVRINFHQDTPVTKPKMLHSVWCAANRVSRSGAVIGEKQAISVYNALKAVTIDAAYAYFEEDSKGSIKVGKRADLVILDRSPLEVDTLEIKDIEVLETIKDGETIFRKQ